MLDILSGGNLVTLTHHLTTTFIYLIEGNYIIDHHLFWHREIKLALLDVINNVFHRTYKKRHFQDSETLTLVIGILDRDVFHD